MKKREFDVIVIGAGSGLGISSGAAGMGYKVAVVDPGPFGGTCLNRGCIPSKMLIHHADIAETIRNSKKFGITSKLTNVQWKRIVTSVSKIVDKDAKEIESGNRKLKGVTVFKSRAKFVDHKTLRVGNQIITARKIFVCAGARPFVPPIPGLESVDFMTSKEALRLAKQPKKLIIIGGGYIGCEMAHFYGGLGTKVIIIDRNSKLMKNEDDDISQRFTEVYGRKHKLVLNAKITGVSKKGKEFTVSVEASGKKRRIKGDALLVATGRRPNTDLLDVEAAGIKTDKRGFIEVDEHMETSVPNVFAIGDIVGKYMFKHSANWEAGFAFNNAFGKKQKVDYTAMPHAAFTSPQVAGVGKTEKELIKGKVAYEKNVYAYDQTGYGFAIKDHDGFVKVLTHAKTKKILGCHIIGTHASILIHEVVVAMKAGLGKSGILSAVHVHPALSEVVQRAFRE